MPLAALDVDFVGLIAQVAIAHVQVSNYTRRNQSRNSLEFSPYHFFLSLSRPISVYPYPNRGLLR